jgi:hypothetical protein
MLLFCPKCGTKSLEDDQRFCKSCGTNLNGINEVLEKGGKPEGNKDFKSVALDVASNIADSIKDSIGEVTINKNPRLAQKQADWEIHKQAEIEKWKARHEARLKRREARKAELAKPQMPKPKEWLAYSRQHNLKYGLITLLGGGGFGLFLYYAGKMALESGLVQQIEDAAQQHPVVGLEFGLRVIWMIAAIPILKGFGQLLYAAFFAESIKTLAERFAPPQQSERTYSRDTAPQDTSPMSESSKGNVGPLSPLFGELAEPPMSVTEGTTKFFDDAEPEPQESRVAINRSASERG